MINKINSLLAKHGLFYLTKYLLLRIISILLGFPIALFIIIIYPFKKVIFIRLFSYRIGHYALNTELLLCAIEEKTFGETKNFIFLFYNHPNSPICNKQLYKMWKRIIRIIPFSQLWFQVDKYLKFFLGTKYKNNLYKVKFENAYGSCDEWDFLKKNKIPHLFFHKKEIKTAEIILSKLGIPKNKKFICLLGRDDRYLNLHLPGVDWSYHDFRNVKINDFQLAIEYLCEQGFYVVRMGKNVAENLNICHPHVIDYANHPLRSDFMDIYLSANCFFFISPRSGIDAVAQIFRRPLLVTNLPLCDYHSLYSIDLFIPKKMIDLTNNEFIKFSDVFFYKDIFPDKKLMIEKWITKKWWFVDNTPDEILDATKEMLLKLTKKWGETIEGHLLQEKFWKIVIQNNLETYYFTKVKIGEIFIKKNLTLLS